MKMEVIAIKDRALDAYMRPFYAQTIGQAIRMFQDEIKRPDGEMAKHPDDYDLYHLGTWDDQDGTTTQQTPKQIAIGKHFKPELIPMQNAPGQYNG